MPQRCTICTHPKRYVIDRALVAAAGSKRGIARQYGLTPDAVERHAASHLPQTLVKAQRIKEVAHADSLFTEMKELIKKGRQVLAWAQKQRSIKGGHLTLAAIRELRETFETLAKTAAELKSQQQATEALPSAQVREELDRKLDVLAERFRQAEAAAPKCPHCGQAMRTAPTAVREKPAPSASGVH